MKTAIVTGASSGLGKEFVRRLAGRKDVDELWVIARREDCLVALQELTSKPVKILPMDLTDPESMEKLATVLAFEKPNIRYLVNAAGLGKIGLHPDLSLEEHDQMILLNCKAAVDVSMTCLPYMFKGSHLINICSTAGNQPLPGLGTYAASKAFLINWTKSLHKELLFTGIKVTAVCPYWVKDTEFIGVAQDTDDNAKSAVKHFPLAGKTKGTVRWALAGARLNLWVTSTSPVALVHRLLTWQLPDWVSVNIWELVRRI